MDTYKIIRMYQRLEHSKRVIARSLTLEEAQAHCHDKQTSSSTCTTLAGRQRTKHKGPWFDGYEKE